LETRERIDVVARARSRSTARQTDAPRSFRGLLSGIRARAESGSHEASRGTSSGRTQLAAVEREIRKLVQAIKDSVSAVSIKDEILALEAKNADLQSRLSAPEMPELLHSRMADVYREKVGSVCQALESEESRAGAVDAIRALIETILLEPHGEKLKYRAFGTNRMNDGSAVAPHHRNVSPIARLLQSGRPALLVGGVLHCR
jgi:hypothetical protein